MTPRAPTHPRVRALVMVWEQAPAAEWVPVKAAAMVQVVVGTLAVATVTMVVVGPGGGGGGA